MQLDRLHWSAHTDLLSEYEKEDALTKAGANNEDIEDTYGFVKAVQGRRSFGQ